MSSAQVDQLFNHLSQQLVQVRSSVSDALQDKYDYYTSCPGRLSAEVVDDIARQLTALSAIIDHTDKVLIYAFSRIKPSAPRKTELNSTELNWIVQLS